MTKRQTPAILLFLLILAWHGASTLRGDDFDQLRDKWWTQLTGGTNYNLADSLVKSRLTTITNSASGYWNSMTKTAGRTNLWSDLTSTTVSAELATAYSRLRAMALAHSTHGSGLRSNATLAADIQGGLDWLYANRYNETKVEYDNWYHWELGVPLQIVDLAVLMYDTLGMAGLSNSLKAVGYFTPSPTSHGLSGTFTGANLADRIRIVSVRGAVVRDAAKLVAARDALSRLFPYVTVGDGFYTDGSFIQHTCHPYTGSYGNVLLDDLAVLLPFLKGSPWECTDPARTNLMRWIYDSYEPLIYRGAMMDMVRGRGVSRSGSQDHSMGHSSIQSILRLLHYGSASDTARIGSMIKYWMQADSFRDFTNNIPLPLYVAASQLARDPAVTPRPELIGHWTFGSMARVVHLRPGWGFGLSMSSSTIANYEYMNTENAHGWFQGEGMTYLYNSDLSQFSDDFWPTVDPSMLPGTTVETTTRANGSGQSYRSGMNWVGGVTLFTNGACGMELDAYNSPLTARKSWFMFDDEVVCLGSGITDSSGAVVQTVVENRKIPTANTSEFIMDGSSMPAALGWATNRAATKWCSLSDSGGYYFPGGTSVRASRQTRTGSWSQINGGGTSTTTTRNYLTLWLDHGINPSRTSYAYAILPNASSAQVSQYSISPDFTILENSTNIQAVKETSLDLLAANFWRDGSNTVDILTCSNKASALLQTTATHIYIAVSDPTQTNTGSLQIFLNRAVTGIAFADPGVQVTQLSPVVKLSVNVNGAAGRSFTAGFNLPSQFPKISALVDRTIDEDTATSPIAFTVVDQAGSGSNLIVYANSTNTTLLPAKAFTFSGGGSSRSLTVLPATNQSGVATVSVVVTDGIFTNSSRFSLTVLPVNDPPVISPMVNSTISPGFALGRIVQASDPDIPAQGLTFSLLESPAGAKLGSGNGLFTWRPGIAQANSTNPVMVRVTDNGTPPCSATQGFSITVRPATIPTVRPTGWSTGSFGFSISGDPGPDYIVLGSTNLNDWTTVLSTNPATMPFQFTDPAPPVYRTRYYRVKLGP